MVTYWLWPDLGFQLPSSIIASIIDVYASVLDPWWDHSLQQALLLTLRQTPVSPVALAVGRWTVPVHISTISFSQPIRLSRFFSYLFSGAA